jgi:hypothetical protein
LSALGSLSADEQRLLNQVPGRTYANWCPPRATPSPLVLTQVIRDRCFTMESSIPMFRMRFHHELVPVRGLTEVIHRVTFSGPLTWVLARLLARRLNSGLAVTLARLQAVAGSR